MHSSSELVSQAGITHAELGKAADANLFVQQYRNDTQWWSACWTEETIAKKPPVRVEFEFAIVFGTLSEALSIRKGKNSWGAMIAIAPLRHDDPLHPTRIVYTLKPESKMRQRWEFRDTFKNLLGNHRGLVNDAVRLSKGSFVSQLTEAQRIVLDGTLELTPEAFWRAVRYGEKFGANGIHAFVKRLRQRTEGYEFDFDAFALPQ
jgi:hypothetical protein